VRVRVRRGDERFVSRGDGIESRYAFSFAEHYDPDHVRFGPLLAVNEEHLAPGAGFAPHRHRDVEIVTWVAEGELEHRGGGHTARVRPGDVQRLSAGGGVEHEERNAPGARGPVRFVQMWLEPGTFGGPPHYTHAASVLGAGPGLLPVASGLPGHTGAIPLRNGTAALHAGRLAQDRPVELPRAPLLYLHVVHGSLLMAGERLNAGDAVAVTDAGALDAQAPEGGAELLVWELHGVQGAEPLEKT
jgi:quercetin 2,3-dioxygenase